MPYIRVIGVDPGETSGLATLDWNTDSPGSLRRPEAHIAQCTHGMTRALVKGLIEAAPGHVLLAVEEFDIRRNSARAASAGALTRDLIGVLAALGQAHAEKVVKHPAHTVKAWATEDRMRAGGYAELAKGMSNHGLDAMRHALYSAVRYAGLPDPLSRKRGGAPDAVTPGVHTDMVSHVTPSEAPSKSLTVLSQTTGVYPS